MTEKRFKHHMGLICEKRDGEYYSFTVKEVCDLLNAQHETIEQLKKDNKILMDKVFEMRTNDALDRTEISRQHYSVDEFLEELEKW